MEPPEALMIVDLREAALIYDLTKEAAQDGSLDSSTRRTAAELHEDMAELMGRGESNNSQMK